MGDRFDVLQWDEVKVMDLLEGKMTRARVKVQYHGTIQGTSESEYTLVYLPDKSTRFSQIEKLECMVDGKEGTLVFQGGGSIENGVVVGTSHVVLAQGGLAGLVGRKQCSAGHADAYAYRWEPM